jgi:ankyrin repeat protein
MGGMGTSFLDYLLSLGVDFSQPNEMGHTPLGKAAFKGSLPFSYLQKIAP